VCNYVIIFNANCCYSYDTGILANPSKGDLKLKSYIHGLGSNQFLSVNIGVIRLLSVITKTPFGNYGTSETMFDQKRWKKTKNIGKILPILSFTEQ
jgi:hypothetical protein